MEEKLKQFHGEEYREGTWDSKSASCCKLCKTKNSEGRHGHWAKGLCRSCYRRLSVTHRLYNDKWNEDKVEGQSDPAPKKGAPKKNYKNIDPNDIQFSDKDVSSLLERYNFQCAYCETDLQDFDHKKVNAFQLEYKQDATGSFELIPACRACNCSKKNLSEPEKLKRWAYEKGLKYPFQFKPAPKD